MRFILSLAFALALGAPATTLAATPQPVSQDDIRPKDRNNDNERPDLPDTTIGDDFRVESSVDTIGASVNQPGGGGGAGVVGPVSFGGTAAPRCTHRPATYGEYPNVVPAGSGDIPDPTSQVDRDNDGRAERGWVRVCSDGGTSDPFYWAPVDVDPVDLIPDALANARTQLAAPTPAINPDATAGGIVNLGMWLAIDDPGTTTARATLAGVWAQVTATVTGIAVDLGNGDTVECDGLGTPIPDIALDSLDQGPCGYTYRRSSPDDDPYQLTITTNFDIAFNTSNGQSGTLAGISRSVTIDYDVDEIQTVGVSN